MIVAASAAAAAAAAATDQHASGGCRRASHLFLRAAALRGRIADGQVLYNAKQSDMLSALLLQPCKQRLIAADM